MSIFEVWNSKLSNTFFWLLHGKTRLPGCFVHFNVTKWFTFCLLWEIKKNIPPNNIQRHSNKITIPFRWFLYNLCHFWKYHIYWNKMNLKWNRIRLTTYTQAYLKNRKDSGAKILAEKLNESIPRIDRDVSRKEKKLERKKTHTKHTHTNAR